MILQEKIKEKAKGYGQLAPAFLEGAEFAINEQWISVDDDLPCNHEELITADGYYEKETANVIDFSVRMTIMKLVNWTAVFNCFPDAWNVQGYQTTGNKRKRKYSANAQESNQKRPSIANDVFCDF